MKLHFNQQQIVLDIFRLGPVSDDELVTSIHRGPVGVEIKESEAQVHSFLDYLADVKGF